MSGNIFYCEPQDATPSPLPQRTLPYPKAWTPARLRKEDYWLDIPDPCLHELDAVVAALRADPLPTPPPKPERFRLSGCRACDAALARPMFLRWFR